MKRTCLILAVAALSAGAVFAAENPSLTIYRADGDALFQNGTGPVADGYAIVHEQRAVRADAAHTILIDGLPSTLDPEAVAVDLGGARIAAQRVMSSGDGGVLAAHRGQKVTITSGGRATTGTLLGVDNGAPIIRDDATGAITYAHQFDAMQFAEGGAPGSTLQIVVAGDLGSAPAMLTYPTSGLGWRAAYSALLLGESPCRVRLESLASIANRSGRDYPQAALKLIAGSPQIAGNAPTSIFRHRAEKMSAEAAAMTMPDQSALGDYRSYVIGGALDLPDASVTQVPLYAPVELDCRRAWTAQNSGAWFPPHPMTRREDVSDQVGGRVFSELHFSSNENLPAGAIRVSMRDRDRRIELLGSSNVADTPKGKPVDLILGQAFDLTAARERTTFEYDRATHTITEGFHFALANTGETARTITVREHPNRWRAWTLVSSSMKPAKQTPDELDFDVPVAGNGKATLDYVVKYAWTAQDEAK